MIFQFSVRTDEGKDVVMYLTEDSKNKFMRRAVNTYALRPDQITILNTYDETSDWGYKLKESFAKENKVDKKVYERARDIFYKASRRSEPYKTDYAERHKCKIVDNISNEKDLYPLLDKYKFVKVCWDLGEKRGEHIYYAFVK